MKENIGDIVIEKMKKRRDAVRVILAKQYKGVKPFRMTPATDNDLLEMYNQLTPEKMNELVTQYGEDEVNQYIVDMEYIKQGRMMNYA